MKKFVSVESLRGWMAWWVVATHAIQLTGTAASFERYPMHYLTAGHLAVNVFMVISGFVISHLLLQGRETYGVYLFRRGWRLFPLMVVMIAVSLLLRDLYISAYIDNHWGYTYMRQDRMDLEQRYWPFHLLAHLTMLHGLVPDNVLKYSSSSFLGPAWSISLEWQFYIVAPLLLAAITRPTVKGGLVVAAFLLLSALGLKGVLGTWQYESFLPLALVYFLAGMTVRLLFEAIAEKSALPWYAIAILAVAFLIYVHILGLRFKAAIVQFGVIVSICALFFTVTAREMGVFAWKSALFDRLSWLIALNPVAVALGRVSYSTYLCHIPVFVIVVGGALRVTGDTSHANVIAWTLVAMVLVVPASFLSYRYIEAPSIELGRRFLQARRQPRLSS